MTVNDTQDSEWLKVIEDNWSDIGMCGSCGWHALFHEHEIDEADVEDALKEGGNMQMFCVGEMEDSIDHRGARFNLYELRSSGMSLGN